MRKSLIAIALTALLLPAAALAQTDTSPKANADANAASSTSGKNDANVYEELNLFGEAFERIRHDAVDPVADDKLVRTAVDGMLASLDPHSVYLSESEYKALASPPPDGNGSIGLVLTIDDGQIKVVAPRDGSPAAAAGIKPGDFIYSIDKEPTYDVTLPEVEQKLRGPIGSQVSLLLRRSNDKPLRVEVKRAADALQTVADHLEASDIGYIRIAGFDASTPDALATAVKDLRQQAAGKLIGFILDLRNNPGGNFDDAVKVADAFIDKGDIAIIKSRKSESAKHIPATPGDIANGQPIVALINSGTAREAELVAGALHDNKRAELLGSKTFGESAIETLIPLKGNGAIRLTTARFLTPNGNAIQGAGLDPDLAVAPLKLEKISQAERLREADLRGALKNPDVLPPAPQSSEPAKTAAPAKTTTIAAPPKENQPTVAASDLGTSDDEQLSEAIDVLRGLALASGRTAEQ
jgi:carboxyl-terminal processing protease